MEALDLSRESSRKYRAEHLEEVRAKDRIRGHKRYLKNTEAMKTSHRIWRRKLRKRVIESYGGKCACCGEARIEFLAIDHIGGGGTKAHRDAHAFGFEYYRVIEKEGFQPDRYRVLCHNCNQSIGWYGYCPHEKERGL